jgi:hypothetical protein
MTVKVAMKRWVFNFNFRSQRKVVKRILDSQAQAMSLSVGGYQYLGRTNDLWKVKEEVQQRRVGDSRRSVALSPSFSIEDGSSNKNIGIMSSFTNTIQVVSFYSNF